MKFLSQSWVCPLLAVLFFILRTPELLAVSEIGEEVEAWGTLSVWSKPGGDLIETVKQGTKGKILEGPVKYPAGTGENFWKVKWANGAGWSLEIGMLGSAGAPTKEDLERAVVTLWQGPATSVINNGQKAAVPTGPVNALLQVQAGAVDAASVPDLGTLKKGNRVALPLFGGKVIEGRVNLVRQEDGEDTVRVAGSLLSGDGGSFVIARQGKAVSAVILPAKSAKLYELAPQEDGSSILRERAASEMICQMPREPWPKGGNPPVAKMSAMATAAATEVPSLSSRPGAKSTLYLDFDGETVTDPDWNDGKTIHAQPSELSADEIRQVWTAVAEDYAPFDVNVTTSRAAYDTTLVKKRMRVIITPTEEWYDGDAGGVAFLESFRQAGTGIFSTTVPAWVFNTTVKGVQDAISHELGHTLGLSHDGTFFLEYYEGHGSGEVGWGPIMGAPYDYPVTQWSKGEYDDAYNKEQDLAIIASIANGIGFVADEGGASRTAPLGLNVVDGAIAQGGVIGQPTDVDFYILYAGAGKITVEGYPGTEAGALGEAANLDLALELQDSQGNVLASAKPDLSLSATLTWTVTEGTYYLKVQGSGRGNIFGDGYSNYGSLGHYLLRGSLPGVPGAPVFTSATTASGTVGVDFVYLVQATNSPTSYWTSMPLPAGITFDAQSGKLSGNPVQEGMQTVTFFARNAKGTTSLSLQINVSPPAIREAIDQFTDILTEKTGTSQDWNGQTEVTHDGIDAARSGLAGDSESNSFGFTINGPGQVSFHWKVSSQGNSDFLQFLIDDEVQFSISGETEWASRTVNLASGSHRVLWRYQKDASGSAGMDAGFVDEVRIASPATPVITSADTAEAVIRKAFSYKFEADRTNTYLVTGQPPPGLTYDAATRTIKGTPTAVGTYQVNLEARNDFGSASKNLTIRVVAPISLAEAMDQPSLAWTTGGTSNWQSQISITSDGVDAGQSGKLSSAGSTWVQTTVTGPARVSFYWRLVSEQNFDFLDLVVDGARVEQATGIVDWTQKTIEVGPGMHTLNWLYTKGWALRQDDGAWLDRVTVEATTGAQIVLDGDLDFGQVQTDITMTRMLTIKNTGVAPLIVTGITYPDGFTGAWSGTLPAGRSQVVPVTFAPTAVQAYGDTLTVNSNSAYGTNTLAVMGQGIPGAAAGSTFRATDTPRPIPDLGTATSTLVVTGMPTVIPVSDISLSFQIDHDYTPDLIVTLVSPKKQRYVIVNRLKTGSTKQLLRDNVLLANIKTNTDPNGTWSLIVQDKSLSKLGKITNWSLKFKSYVGPTFEITQPSAAETTITTASVSFTGTASDDKGIAKVFYRLSSAAKWATATYNKTTKVWMKKLSLSKKGTYTYEFKAADTNGLESQVVTRRIIKN